jgi:hypothetical protein
MIINMSSVKTEALLLFCRDLLNSYKNSDENSYNINKITQDFICKNIDDLLNAINVVIQKNEYYIQNSKVSRIKIIISFYNKINNLVSSHLSKTKVFNPTMLCYSLLATWFKELEYDIQSQEYLYFNLYPYSEIFDMLIVKIDDTEYKKLNIAMISIAEDVMINLHNKGLND